MSTAFGGAPTHGDGPVHDEYLPMGEFPAWGIDIMAGLYGPETVRVAREAEQRRLSPAVPHECVTVSPLMLELEAVTEFGRLIERLIQRMVRRLAK